MIDRAAADALAATLESAWNAADGSGFAAAFAEDADFVNVMGHHAHGRDEIAAGHDAILATIYQGSRNRLTVEQLRPLGGSLAGFDVTRLIALSSE